MLAVTTRPCSEKFVSVEGRSRVARKGNRVARISPVVDSKILIAEGFILSSGASSAMATPIQVCARASVLRVGLTKRRRLGPVYISPGALDRSERFPPIGDHGGVSM
jgi:hypothetical protein